MSADGIDTPPPSDNPSLPATNASIEHPELTPQRDEGTPATDAADSLAGTKGPDPPTLAMSRDEDHALTNSTFDDSLVTTHTPRPRSKRFCAEE